MNKNLIIIVVIILIIIGAGLIYLLNPAKECRDLNEQECKKNDSCLSVLVPCTDPSCVSDAVFQECKAKGE
ncbi:MAG: hypothetical protein V1838_03700 [Patescibacteria group bacterium]